MFELSRELILSWLLWYLCWWLCLALHWPKPNEVSVPPPSLSFPSPNTDSTKTQHKITILFWCIRFYWKAEWSHLILYTSPLHFRYLCSWLFLFFFFFFWTLVMWVSGTSDSLPACRSIQPWYGPVFRLAALAPDFSICSPEIDTAPSQSHSYQPFHLLL